MKIALTGMIAAGKSTALGVLRGLGWEVLATDDLARTVALSKEGKAKAAELMGYDCLPTSAEFKERFVSDPVFKKAWERFIHPHVRSIWEGFVRENQHGHVVVELPLLYENELESRFDKVVVLTTSEDNAKRRWQKNGRSLELYQSLSKHLIPIDQKVAKADFVIKNNNNLSEFVCQIEALHQKLITQYAREKIAKKRRRGC